MPKFNTEIFGQTVSGNWPPVDELVATPEPLDEPATASTIFQTHPMGDPGSKATAYVPEDNLDSPTSPGAQYMTAASASFLPAFACPNGYLTTASPCVRVQDVEWQPQKEHDWGAGPATVTGPAGTIITNAQGTTLFGPAGTVIANPQRTVIAGPANTISVPGNVPLSGARRNVVPTTSMKLATAVILVMVVVRWTSRLGMKD